METAKGHRPKGGTSTAATPRGAPDSSELYRQAIEMIGRRWTGAILRSMLAGSVRFTEIRASIPDLSDRLLAERLRELEAEGVAERRVVSPRHIEYHLTAKGQALAPVVDATASWAEDWLAQKATRRRKTAR